MPPFAPRATFPTLPSLPRSYFLGHHKSGLSKMQSLLSSIDLVLECRDYRIPLTSRNPLFEKALEGKDRLVVYTKRDLGVSGRHGKEIEDRVRSWDELDGKGRVGVCFTKGVGGGDEEGRGGSTGKQGKKSVKELLETLKQHAEKKWKLVGHRVMVVGMPNVGKSTLLNALRAQGMGKGKVAGTGAQPGVTRKVSTGVKIVPGEDDFEDPTEEKARDVGGALTKGVGGGVYLLDTPGVFIPYVPSSHAMLKLALVGSVKDTIIPPVLLADYLLYHINLHDPELYREFSFPTNDIMELLENVARSLGRLGKGGAPDSEAAALWLVQRWRRGDLGRFLLDEVDEGAWERVKREEEGREPSWNQARKMERERRRERGRAKAGLV
ncbi:P-loop containing nucleoside triphosphate hydrolase protein [Sporormia fimetaria CBS 119925]|uniref:P-loop containing nucleoside triphosphate hydrolase protein n=1 Tax=Sporormia fimetaria CBS 119925 TaxID=1340428 RepID=A0A6A6VN65_9PLEO|nr:P-loop containing nucleoside triphosphate hydrolase protein [Sporormia fimetaria CBS 119925]